MVPSARSAPLPTPTGLLAWEEGAAGSEQKLQPEEFLPALAVLVENPQIRSLIF